MIDKQKIIEILNNESVSENSSNNNRIIIEQDFEIIADEIVKNCSIKSVSVSISVENTVNAFLDWMQSDDCWINDKDGKRIPDAQIDGTNFMKYAEKYYR